MSRFPAARSSSALAACGGRPSPAGRPRLPRRSSAPADLVERARVRPQSVSTPSRRWSCRPRPRSIRWCPRKSSPPSSGSRPTARPTRRCSRRSTTPAPRTTTATRAARPPTPVTWDIDVETYHDHDRVQYYLDFFQGKGRERMGIWLTRMPRYEAMIRERLQEQGLPGDLVYLALIESGFSNSATSRARAVGMWQFMKGTGEGLRAAGGLVGGRAARSLPRHRRGGAASPAISATGSARSISPPRPTTPAPGKVSRGLRRLPDDDADSLNSDATFFRLYDTKLLRRETKDYVPKLIAAALIAKEPARYGFAVAAAEPAAYDSIIVPTMTGLDVIARLADTTVAAMRELNPQYLRLATPPGVPLGRPHPGRARARPRSPPTSSCRPRAASPSSSTSSPGARR